MRAVSENFGVFVSRRSNFPSERIRYRSDVCRRRTSNGARSNAIHRPVGETAGSASSAWLCVS